MSLLLSLLLIQASIHCVSSRKLDPRYLTDKVCKDVKHLEVDIAGSGVTCGGEMNYDVVNFVANSPLFRYRDADENKLYMIFMVDADEPGCKTKLHYMIGNVPGKKLAERDNSVKDVFSVYFPPELPRGSPVHRYFFYAFSQTNPIADLAYPAGNCDFKLGTFMDDVSLTLVAVNMFKIKND